MCTLYINLKKYNYTRFPSGRIKAIQLEYSQSHVKLTQAMRKAPQNSAIGFKQTV